MAVVSSLGDLFLIRMRQSIHMGQFQFVLSIRLMQLISHGLTSMHFHVRWHRAPAGEALGAQGAAKWFLARVRALMGSQIGRVPSCKRAEPTQVLLVALVPVPEFLYLLRTQ